MNGVLDYKIAIDSSAAVAAAGKVKAAIGGVVAAFAGFKGVQGVISGVTDAIKKGTDLSSLFTQTGVAVKDLVVLQRAFIEVSDSAESLAPALMQFQRALGGVNDEGEPTAKIFQRLGLSIDSLKKMSVPDALLAIQKGMQKLPDAASRTSAALQIFGRSGKGMLEIMNSPGVIEDMIAKYGKVGFMWESIADTFSKIYVKFAQFRASVGDIFSGIASGLAPALAGLLDLVRSIDFAKWSKDIGNAAGFIVDAFKNDNIAEVVALSLKIGFGEAVNYLAGALNASFDAFAGVMSEAFSVDCFKGLAAGFEGLGDILSASILRGFQEPVIWLQSKIEWLATKFLAPILPGTKRVKRDDGTEDFVPAVSEEQIRKSRREDGAGLFIPGLGELGHEELGARGASKLKEAALLLKNPTKKLGEAVSDAAKKFKPVDVVDVKDGRAKLKAAYDDFVQNVGAAREKISNSQVIDAGEKYSGVKNGKSGAANTDQFARVGWFVGNGGPSLDYARRTAAAAEKLLSGLTGISNKLDARNVPPGAVWA
ncbi:MAG: hypothetical protein LBD30_03560 [Verrucomicrobiales bacterium]|nr:hypothetical protein [Verrucomicrobiales bacterium]